MKKGSLFLVFVSTILFVSMFGAVSAASQTFRPIGELVSSAIDTVVEVTKPLLQSLVGDISGNGAFSSSDMFLAKVLLLIILIAIVYSVLSTIGLLEDNGWILWIVSLGVGVLGIRFLSAGLIEMIVMPYSVMGVAITASIPFIIYFFFVEKGMASPKAGPTLRRAAWIFFAVIFLAIWTLRSNDIPEYAWIYPMTALLAFVMALMDGTVQRFFMRVRIEKAGFLTKQELEADLSRKINQANSDATAGIITPESAQKRIKTYRKLIANLHK